MNNSAEQIYHYYLSLTTPRTAITTKNEEVTFTGLKQITQKGKRRCRKQFKKVFPPKNELFDTFSYLRELCMTLCAYPLTGKKDRCGFVTKNTSVHIPLWQIPSAACPPSVVTTIHSRVDKVLKKHNTSLVQVYFALSKRKNNFLPNFSKILGTAARII